MPRAPLSAVCCWKAEGYSNRDARNAAMCSILWCMVITGFAATTSYPLAIALLFCAGLAQFGFLSMAQTLVQLGAPTQLRGRLIGLFNMSHNGLKAFSGVTVGRDRRADRNSLVAGHQLHDIAGGNRSLICVGYSRTRKRGIPLSGPPNG